MHTTQYCHKDQEKTSKKLSYASKPPTARRVSSSHCGRGRILYLEKCKITTKKDQPTTRKKITKLSDDNNDNDYDYTTDDQ